MSRAIMDEMLDETLASNVEHESHLDSNSATAPAKGEAPNASDLSPEEASDARQLEWYRDVYQGDKVPQLTFRAVIMGGLLGALMSISNLYTAIKLGWLFAIAITACVLSFSIWRCVRFLNPKISDMSILESNCMQSTASSAGYSTGSTIATAFGAHLLITGHHIDWKITAVWTLITALLGVLLAVPMKQQMINRERLPFPSGIAAAETLKSLYGGSKEAVYQAYSLLAAMLAGILTGLASKGEWAWQYAIKFKLPELIAFPLTLRGVDLAKFPGFGFEPSLMLISAGMIVGLRVSASMLLSASILYLGFGPWLMQNHIIVSPAKLLSGWALWTGTAIMVSAGLTAFVLQWQTIVRSLRAVKGSGSEADREMEAVRRVEVPMKWFWIGIIPLAIIFAGVEYLAFKVSLPLGIFSVVMSFFLALVACRATGETDITPIGAMGKISQLAFAVLSPNNITTNLMAASVTANTASASADLLSDLKSGYLLGANARRQFLAQLTGVFFGTIAIVPAWYLMIPNKEALEAYNPPSTTIFKAVAEALSHGIGALPESARMGILIGAIIGCVLTVAETLWPKVRKFTPSPMGLGLAWVMPFQNCLSFFVGALIAWVWKKFHAKSADTFTIPVASGAIAGESLACAFIAILNALVALHILGR